MVPLFGQIYSAVHPQVHTRTRVSRASVARECRARVSRASVARESHASCARVQLALELSAVASVTQISIYGIATDDYHDYVSFKLLIVNVFVPAVLL